MIRPALSLSASLRLPLIEAHLRRVQPISVVEVGCGKGAMGVRLADRYYYEGYEPDLSSYRAAEAQFERMKKGTVINSAFPSDPVRQFDMLVAFEVIEHIEDDASAVAAWTRWIKPGGHLLLSTPAHPHRFGPSDVAVGHYRRYARSGLMNLLTDNGLKVHSMQSWGMPLGYLLEWSRNTYLKHNPKTSSKEAGTARSGRMFQPPSWLGRAVEWGVLPFAVLQHPFRSTDYGIGYVVLAEVPL